jgi:hypothetical protein
MLEHAHYRFLIDIDGAASAWSFFEKLLLGGCILKVGSPFEQWFYSELTEWQHFVPVRQDLSDLFEKIEWCHGNQDEARAIGERAQQFAIHHTFKVARDVALDAVRRSLVPLFPEPSQTQELRGIPQFPDRQK